MTQAQKEAYFGSVIQQAKQKNPQMKDFKLTQEIMDRLSASQVSGGVVSVPVLRVSAYMFPRPWLCLCLVDSAAVSCVLQCTLTLVCTLFL